MIANDIGMAARVFLYPGESKKKEDTFPRLLHPLPLRTNIVLTVALIN
jgi:hypothetical protein